MRLRLTALLAALTGCAPALRQAPAPPPQASVGAASAFGTGIVSASVGAITVALSAPAYAVVVRVFPGERAEFVAASGQLLAGTRSIDLPVERTRVWVAPAARYQLTSSRSIDPATDPDPVCLRQRMQLATIAGATRSQDPASPQPAEQPRTGILCIRTPTLPTAATPTTGHWEVSDAGPMGEHYLVVVAAETPFDAPEVAELLGELDISRVSGDAAAAVIPRYLLGERGVRWGAWILHRP